MANKKINELSVRTPLITDLMLVGDPSTGYSYQCTALDISNLVASGISLNALSDVVISSPAPNQVLQYNGTNWVNATITTGGITGSGTTNYIPKFTSSSAIGNSVLYETSNNIGIGTTTPDIFSSSYTGTILGVSSATGNSAIELNGNTNSYFDMGGSGTKRFSIQSWGSYTLIDGYSSIPLRFRINNTDKLAVTSAGVGIGITIPAATLDVYGNVNILTIVNATIDTDRFLVHDSGLIKYRTGAQMLSDIGGQGALTLTTTGTSGAATLIGNTLNIPIYSGGGGVGGSGTTNYISKWTASTTLGDSLIEDTGTILQTRYLTNNIGFKFDYINNFWQVKDDNGNGLEISSAASNSTILLGDYVNGYGLYLDTATGITKLGDYTALYNFSHHVIDPSTGEMYTIMSGSQVGYYFNVNSGIFAYGDYNNNLNYWWVDVSVPEMGTKADGNNVGIYIKPQSKWMRLGDYSNAFGSNAHYEIDWNGSPLHTWNLGNNGRMRILSGTGQRSGYIQSAFGNFLFGNNIYYNQPNWVYDGNGYGVYIQTEAQTTGSISFLTAPLNSGGAGVLATPVGRMTIFNDGVIVINKFVTSTYRLDIGASTNGLRVTGSGTTSATIGLRVETSGAVTNLQVLDNGNVGIREPNPSARLHLIHSGATTASIGLKVRNSADTLDILKTYGNTQVQIASTASALEASAQLQIDSTNRGVLFPRMTNAEVLAIATPANGLVVYNTTISHLVCYQGGVWVKFSHSPM